MSLCVTLTDKFITPRYWIPVVCLLKGSTAKAAHPQYTVPPNKLNHLSGTKGGGRGMEGRDYCQAGWA